MLQINVVILDLRFRVEASGHDGKAVFIAAVQNLKTGLSICVLETLEKVAKKLSHIHLIRHLGTVSVLAKAQQLVKLYVGTGGWPGEVERHGVTVPSKVRHGHGNVFRQVLALPEDHPSSATDTLAKLVSTRRHGQHVRETKVKGRWAGRTEGSNESTTRRIDMDSNLPALLRVEFLELGVNVPDGIINAIVVIAEDGHHTNGLLVALGHKMFCIDGHLIPEQVGMDENGFHIKVSKEFLPSCLVTSRHDKVGLDALDLLLRQTVASSIPLTPTELVRQS